MEGLEVAWHDLHRLRELADSSALDPLKGRLQGASLELVRRINERILGLDPTDYLPALRISRVHLAWASRSRGDKAAHHHEQRRVWLLEALLRHPPDAQRAVIQGALSAYRPADRTATQRAITAIAKLRSTTLPAELMDLARSLREEEPRLPHLACIASHRAVAYCDRDIDGRIDPEVLAERYRARCSLGASLRAMRRYRDAIAVAEEAVSLMPDKPIAWTVLIAATQDDHGAGVSLALVQRALSAMRPTTANEDPYLARALVRVYDDAGLTDEATRWLAVALRDSERQLQPRSELLRRGRRLVTMLLERGQAAEAAHLKALLDAAEQRGPLSASTKAVSI